MPNAVYSFLADATMLLHFVFVMFVVGGGLLVAFWPRLAWVHIPAIAWGAWITVSQGICPLTPLEQWLRSEANESTYSGGFIAYYIQPVLYPNGLGYEMKLLLGVLVLLLTLVFYWKGYKRFRRARGQAATTGIRHRPRVG